MTITLETPDTWPGSESPTNPSGERRNVLTVNGVEPDNDGNVEVQTAGDMPAALIVQALQAAYPRLTWLMSGNSTDGQPDTATAAAIDAFMTATGVASDYVAFLDLGAAAASAGTLTIANAYSASSADNVVLVQSHGALVIANAYSGSFADNITLSNPSLLVLAIDDAYSGSFADAVTLVQSHGVLAIADAYSASFADAVTLALAGGALTIADAYSASSADNVVLTAGVSAPTQPVISVTPGDTTNVIALISGGVGATSYNLKWGTVAGTRSNTITSVTLPYTHTGRTNGTAYYYSVVAINGAGSVESAEVSGTPVAASTNFYTQNWDLAATNATTYDGWISGTSGVDGIAHVANTFAWSAPNSFALGGGDGASEGTGWLERTMTIAAGTLSFGLRLDSGSPEPVYVKVYVDGAQVGLTGGYSANNSNYTITISSGSVIRFSGTSLAGAMHIDNISIPIP